MLNRALFLIVVFFLGINTITLYYVGPHAWDDGTITLAYARTVAEQGRFALTNASEIVEGSSSLLLVSLSALAYAIFHFSFEGFIKFSQLLAFLFTLSTMCLLYSALQSKIANKKLCLLLSVLTVSLPLYTAETMNGMEMTLLSTLMLLLVMGYERKAVWTYALIPLILLTRFESICYLLFAFTASAFFEKDKRRFSINFILCTLLVFCLISLARYAYFDDFLPNTIRAKTNPPYTPAAWQDKLSNKFEGVLSFFKLYIGFVIALIYSWRVKKPLFLTSLKFWLLLGYFGFSFVIGKDWGYDGRLLLSSLPIAVLLATEFTAINKLNFLYGPTAEVKLLATYNIALFLGICFVCNAGTFVKNSTRMIAGGYRQNLFPLEANNFIRKITHRPEVETDFGITPFNYRITGQAVDKIRSALGLDTIIFLTPDLGGVALCCDNINIIDSGLLANKFLAKHGYSEFAPFLEKTHPDVIETHQMWSSLTQIYQSAYFKANYIPIVFNKNLLWLNVAHLEKLKNSVASKPILADLAELEQVRYADAEIDKNYILLNFGNKVWFINT